MTKRKLGQSGFEVAPLAFGGNVFGWTVDAAASYRLLDAFVAHGGNLIDTADVYSAWVPGNKGGESETILGEWLKKSGKRNQIVLATKVGMEVFDGKGLSKKHITSAVEESLKRLQTDHIDLYQSHRDDEETPIEETLETYAGLIKAGKIRAIGASNFTAKRLQESVDVAFKNDLPVYQTLQPLYNLTDRSKFEGALQDTCVKNGIGVISYYSLASGFLTGKYRSKDDLKKSARGGGIEKYMDARGMKILSALDQVAKAKGATLAQVSLAWLMSKPAVVAPIASATNVEQLQDIMKAWDLDLDAGSVKVLDEAGA